MSRLQRPAEEEGPVGSSDQARREYYDEDLTGRVKLDGASFDGCRFRNATLVYAGFGAVQISNCEFRGVEFQFEGPAANTLAFLKAMTHPRSGLREIVKASLPALFAH